MQSDSGSQPLNNSKETDKRHSHNKVKNTGTDCNNNGQNGHRETQPKRRQSQEPLAAERHNQPEVLLVAVAQLLVVLVEAQPEVVQLAVAVLVVAVVLLPVAAQVLAAAEPQLLAVVELAAVLR